MVRAIDVYRAAALLIRQHGDDAAMRAARRSDELLAAGDSLGAQTWGRIVRAIEDISLRPLGPLH